ncbi:MAG: hypothetical protein K2Y29_20450, partial [Beijerinckiaceae bacterium]|nr:hypothetical protein [Beijerinckiaceae bacterium]
MNQNLPERMQDRMASAQTARPRAASRLKARLRLLVAGLACAVTGASLAPASGQGLDCNAL